MNLEILIFSMVVGILNHPIPKYIFIDLDVGCLKLSNHFSSQAKSKFVVISSFLMVLLSQIDRLKFTLHFCVCHCFDHVPIVDHG
jgi:hypothetical protein